MKFSYFCLKPYLLKFCIQKCFSYLFYFNFKGKILVNVVCIFNAGWAVCINSVNVNDAKDKS